MSLAYVEMELEISYNELNFPDCLSDDQLPENPFEIEELCKELNINMDFVGVDELYENTYDNSGETLVFHSNDTLEVFIYLDLFRNKYDQFCFVTLGVRVKIEDRLKIKNIMEDLYFRSSMKFDLKEDFFNQNLWRKVNGFNREYKQVITPKNTTEIEETRLKKHYQNGIEITKYE